MTQLIHGLQEADAAFSISLGSIANGAGRVSAVVDLGYAPDWITLMARIRAGGTAPTAGAPYYIYLVRGDGTGAIDDDDYRDEGLGTADAAVTTLPNHLLPMIIIPAIATINQFHYASTRIYNPGRYVSVLLWNGSGQALGTTGTDHYLRYQVQRPQIQNNL